ncbi:hypothetical protein [Leifsonia sp. NPDC058248]|uniref:hypothetical protein n=1 Tax=Leifsonia sp. NPDC058248 TaxID=3346402 RepID=UPI0036DE5042
MNGALFFLMLVGVLFATVGAFTNNTALLAVGQLMAICFFVWLAVRHIDDPEGADE